MIVILQFVLLTILITACSSEQIDAPKVVYVPQKCKATMPERPVTNNDKCGNDDKCIAAKATSNFDIVKAWALKVEATVESCL